ncbi:pentatricopeptide repeat-containing protein At1g50270 [Amborella trichopoda]|nr:pentatricopeptide repeat-containing protein At1g50270 [Amborella trichopoda]|eukprot:XP_006849828.3 pentatricopeptide repeat-containing protein At1g50270 [Amborella trichopoda]
MSSLSKPDRMTVTTILSAQGCLQMVARGREVHAYILRQGLIHQNQNQNGLTNQLIENALIDMYAKSSDVESAKRVFECMAARDLASWTAMISGLMQNGLPALALRIFHSMLKEGITPDDSVSIASVLPAITGAGTLQQGREIHGYTIRNGLKNPFVATALLDMYSKFGCITLSEILFHELLFHERNKNKSSSVVSWSAMIMAYAKHGYTDDALNLFHRMVEETRIKPNHKTLMAILTACSHGGGGSDLVDEAKKWFQCMRDKYQVSPDMYHYAAMVHLLGRAGQLEEAMAFIREMPIEPGPAVWGALLGSCRLHHDVELGERVAQVLSNVEPDNPGNYVLLSNMLAERGRWEDVVKVRELMRDTGLQKKPGFSFVDV